VDNENKCDLIVRNNKLVEAFISMTRNEYKLTLYLISKIKKDDAEFTEQMITLKEFSKLLGFGMEGRYSELKSFERSLVSNNIQLELENGRRKTISWFSYTEYIPNEAILIVKFNDLLRPLLLNIKDNYTKVFLDTILKLNSKHAIRIYEILKQYEKIGERTIAFEDLKSMLGVDKKYTYFNFKQRILLPSQKSLKDSDLSFEFEEIKRGRRVDSIKFNILKNGAEDASPDPDENLIAEENNLSLKNEIENTVGGKLGAKGFKYLVDNVPTNTIKLYLDNWSKFTPGINPIGFFVKACVEKYDIPKMINNKPVQAMNYEQREYDDEFFDSLYVDLDKYKE
jgi:plasmid replication initiation protein